MQIYCLNDDRRLAGFTHTCRGKKNKVAPSLLREVDSFDQRMGKVRFS